MVVRAGREFLAIPGPTAMPDGGAAGDASSCPRHLFRRDAGAERQPDASISQHCLPPRGAPTSISPTSHIFGKGRSSNVLSRGDKILVLESGRFAIGWEQGRGLDGRRGRGAPGRLAPRGAPGRGRARLRRGQGPQHQGDPGGAGRYRLRRRQRHRGHRQGDQGRRSSGAVHGQLPIASLGLHAVRDGRLGHRRREVRFPERPDGAPRPRLRRHQ